VVINRRKKICALDGVGAAAATLDIRRKVTGGRAVANSQLQKPRVEEMLLKGLIR
jgi:hypothetical protein